jgi:nitrogenase molybdenum-iron protein beta chain
VHGSQGCVSYFRTYFNRHFKEPICCVSDSMTEDAAVFGGQKNMFDGLENAKRDLQAGNDRGIDHLHGRGDR